MTVGQYRLNLTAFCKDFTGTEDHRWKSGAPQSLQSPHLQFYRQIPYRHMVPQKGPLDRARQPLPRPRLLLHKLEKTHYSYSWMDTPKFLTDASDVGITAAPAISRHNTRTETAAMLVSNSYPASF